MSVESAPPQRRLLLSRLSPRARLAIGLAALALVALALWFGREATMKARLVRADVEAVARQPALQAFAVSHGRAAFRRHCAACHGADGKGDRATGSPDLTDGDWLYGVGRVSDIEQVVQYGIRAHRSQTWNLAEMPAYAQAVPTTTEKLSPLSPGDIDDVVAFLMQIEDRKADPASAARGGQIFQGRGGCFDCHGSDALGDSAIGAPNLQDHVWLYGDGSPEAAFASIARGRRGVCPGWSGDLPRDEIRAMAVYVHTLSRGARTRTPTS